MTLWVWVLTVGEVCFVLGFYAALRWSDRRARPQERFPAPRDTDCAYGCCKAGDVGLCSELVRPNPRADRR